MFHSKANKLKLFAGLLVLISIIVRVISMPNNNGDLIGFNLPWYQTIVTEGITHALGSNFTDYNPPYTYFLALSTLTKNFLPPLIAVKLIPTLSDVLGAYIVYRIVRLKHPQDQSIPLVAAAVYFSAPTVMLNSSYWGQVDSLYTVSLLACLYFLLAKKPFHSLLMFGLSFSIKLQAVFALPFLAVMIIRRQIPWKHIWAIPAAYLAAILPVMVLGRPILDTLLVYIQQVDRNHNLSKNAPNFYYFFPNIWYPTLAPIGLAFATMLILYWVYRSVRMNAKYNDEIITLCMLISVALVPFLLPKMHDRYFYPADVLSIVLAFYWTSLWFLPVLYQLISMGPVSHFLFHAGPPAIIFSTILNAFTVSVLLKAQSDLSSTHHATHGIRSMFSWVYSIVAVLVMFGLFFGCLLTPFFVRFEYRMPYFPPDRSNSEKYLRYERASRVINYLDRYKREGSLLNLRSNDGMHIFNQEDIEYLAELRLQVDRLSKIWMVSLLALYILTLSAWIGNWPFSIRQMIARSGWFLIGLAIASGIVGITMFVINPEWKLQLFPYLDSTSMLANLFPARFLADAIVIHVLAATGLGVIFVRGSALKSDN